MEISTHALTEGDTTIRLGIMFCATFQLTPSRRATPCRTHSSVTLAFQLTPSRRATGSDPVPAVPVLFQLTPSRRATRCGIFLQSQPGHFNSRPHGGRRLRCNPPPGLDPFQLTPSRRATRSILGSDQGVYHFNSRPHGGRPETVLCIPAGVVYFNSRPHGGRRFSSAHHSGHQYFNSRPHGGRPLWKHRRYTNRRISTHALTEGDPRSSRCPECSYISTHALTEGDINVRGVDLINVHFNSRPHGGRPTF